MALRVEGAAPGDPTELGGLDVTADLGAVVAEGANLVVDGCRLRVRPTSTQEETAALRVSGGDAAIRGSCLSGGGGRARSAGRQVASAGLVLENQTRATVNDAAIRGGNGDGEGQGYGSVAVVVVDAEPTLSGSDLRSGTGRSSMASRAASVGVYLFSRLAGRALSPLVDSCVIDGGSGAQATSQGSGSVGVVASAATGSVFLPRVLGSTIGGGVGTNPVGGAAASAGLAVFQVNLELSRSTVTGGTFDGLTQLGAAVGVNAVSSTVVIEQNSILGASGNYQAVTGVLLGNSPRARVDNNMMHAGRQTSANPLASQALSVGNSAGSSIRHNTIVLSARAGQGDGVSVTASPAPGAVSIENNLMIGGDQSGRTALRLNGCPAGLLSAFSGNAFANLDGRMLQPFAATSFDACPELAAATSLETLQPALVTLCEGASCAGMVAGNVHLRAICSTGTCARLASCFSQDECATSLFQAWSSGDAGVGDLLGPASGWRLRADLDCAAQQSPHTALLGDDRYSAPRTPPYSRGAHEQDGCAP